ncbi:MAG: hemolysin family protein, partial [Ignavibacteria bacterium]|nr:hemolysin family protein [Ignavibacteria bacterium]
MGVQHLQPAFEASDTQWIREGSAWVALAVMVLSIGSMVVVLGELVPKSLALRSSEVVALRFARPIRLFSGVFRIPVTILTAASNLFLRPFKDKTSFAESRISEEEFKLMLEEGTRSGVIDKTEHELISSIFEFTDTTAKEVMIPRPDVVALDLDIPREELVRIAIEEGYSRMPVYRENVDNIIGIVYTKDLLGMMEHRNLIILEDIIRPPYLVPETTKISRLMRDLQQMKSHMAIVIDEYGGTEGVITMEDILEEIVGEIHDEYDEELREVEVSADGSFMVSGRMTVRTFNERFASSLPEEEEYDTVSGFLQKISGGIPEVNDELRYRGLLFCVVKKSHRRIRIVRVQRLKESGAPEADTGSQAG